MSTRGMLPLVLALLALTLSATGARAQQWCDSRSVQPPPYDECVLRLDGHVLARGYAHETIALSDGFSPLPLKRFVTGDSALKYATLYERDGWRAGALHLIGGALLLAGSFTTLGQRGPMDRSHPFGRTGAKLMLGGGAFYLIRLPFAFRADREAELAVRWSNARLHREP
jgi:hypothetical protein